MRKGAERVNTSIDVDDQIQTVLLKYSDMVIRIAFQNLKSMADAEDIAQEVFLKLITTHPDFENPTHEKAWIIRVTVNLCKDFLKSSWFKKRAVLDDNILAHDKNTEVLDAVLRLPVKFRNVIYLHYYEDMKLLFAQDGKILGAQAVGYDGVEKRIDVLGTTLRLGGTVYDLEKLELCYAPPYSSAKDPVNMLGFTASNILRGDTKVFHYDEVDTLDRGKVTLLDVRTPEEVRAGTFDGAVNIPLDDLRSRMNELPKDKPVYAFCQVGLRGYLASRILTQNGYDVYNLSGGYKTYSTAKEDQQKPTGVDCVGIKAPQAAEVKKNACCDGVKMIEVDACGLQCPGPIMKVAEALKTIPDGDCLLIRATDPGFASDIGVWCERTGNLLLSVEREGASYSVKIQKGGLKMPNPTGQAGNDKSMVVFSGDLDKAIAALIIANGAASMGRKVTLFFTFWGLNILRKDERVHVQKNFIEKMFGFMMPRGSKKLGLSRMNMMGMGSKMIRGVMKRKNVTSFEELLQSAMHDGVRIIACQMSMDIMGIKPEELIDGVEIAGVATFLGSAELSDTNLFI